MAHFSRSGDQIILKLDATEVELLRDLTGQLESVLEGGVPDRGDDPVRERLFPRAYLDPTEDAAEGEWQAAVHADLVRQKSAAVEALVDTLDAGAQNRRGNVEISLDPAAVEQWVGALNDLRIALGVVLGITEDEEEPEPGDPRRPGLELWGWLSWLQGSLVAELLRGIDKSSDGGDDE
jgi:hypothetical protein